MTGKLIDELTIYYGLSIRRNSDSVEKMRNEIWSTLYHKMSTDENPQHEKCPIGVDSWCSWQRSKALGTLATYEHKSPMHEDVFKAVQPIYNELSSDNLLSESFNAVVWSIAPKTMSSGKTIVDIAADVAVITFNEGLSGLFAVYDALGLTVGPNMYEFCVVSDANRVKVAEHRMSDIAKKARRSITSDKKKEEEQNKALEGQLYGAGIAD